jgi:hypothetical protein
MRWYELQAENGPKIKGDGAVWAPSTIGDEPAVIIQPGRGVVEQMSPWFLGEFDTMPTEQTSSYARRFGNAPGPEWEVNGRPYSATWTIVLRRDESGALDPYAVVGRFDEVTDAARRAISEWLTSPEVIAEVSNPRAHAVARLDSRRYATKRAREAAEEAKREWDEAEHAEAEARRELRELDESAVADKVKGAN